MSDEPFWSWLISAYGFPVNMKWDDVPVWLREKRKEYEKMIKMSENENCIFDSLFSAKCTPERRERFATVCNACGRNPNNSSAQTIKGDDEK